MSLAKDSNFLISIFLHPNGVHLWYFKLTKFIILNIKGLRHRVAKIQGLENQRLGQKLIYIHIWVFATNSDFCIHISWQLNVVNLWYLIQTLNSVRSSNLSLKYQRFTLSGCKNIWITKFVAKTQFLCGNPLK